MKDDRGQKALAVQKNESNAASVVHAWGLPKTSVPKEEGSLFILLIISLKRLTHLEENLSILYYIL